MRRTLRILAAALAVGVSLWWLATGSNRGWTKTRVPITVVDEVTGISGPAGYQDRLVPGVEVLALAWMGGVALFGVSFFVARNPSPPTHKHT